jgi:hypothetical protein
MEDHLGILNIWNKELLQVCFRVWFGKKGAKAPQGYLVFDPLGYMVGLQLIMFEGKCLISFKVFA